MVITLNEIVVIAGVLRDVTAQGSKEIGGATIVPFAGNESEPSATKMSSPRHTQPALTPPEVYALLVFVAIDEDPDQGCPGRLREIQTGIRRQLQLPDPPVAVIS